MEGTMIRLDIRTLRTTLAEGTSDEKLQLLERWFQQMDTWDIFPLKHALPVLFDVGQVTNEYSAKNICRTES
jgi:hypothetical protein